MIEVIFDMEIVSDAIYRYVHLTEKWGAEVLERHNSIHHNLWHFLLSFEHSMAASWQECHCDSSSHLSLWIKQNPSKLSNLMVLDNNIITTYSGRKALLFLQRGGHLKKPCIHLDSSESTKWNCSASLWNPCILNVHKVIIFTLSYHTSASPGFTCFWHQGIEEAKGSKNMTYKVQKMGRTWLQIFLVYSVLWSYAELPLTWKVVLCVAQKGKLSPNGYCDIQLWILQLLSVLKFTRISHFHQADLYLHLVVTILASSLFGGRDHMKNFSWWKLTAHWESGQSAHNTGLCLYLFGQEMGTLVYSLGAHAAQKQRCAQEGNAAKQTLSLIKPYHSSWKMCIPSVQTYWQKPQPTGILHILMLKWILIKLGFTVDVIRCWSTVDMYCICSFLIIYYTFV